MAVPGKDSATPKANLKALASALGKLMPK